MTKVSKISGFQLCGMLIVSRIFSVFTYKPQSYEIGLVTAVIAIIISGIINFLIFLPVISLLNHGENKSTIDIGYVKQNTFTKLWSVILLIICLFLTVEALTQFEFFMSSTLYLNSSPLFFVIPVILAAVFICNRGVETIARISSPLLVSFAVALVVITVPVLFKSENVWVQSVKYDSLIETAKFILDNITHTTEIIPFMILCENIKGRFTKGAALFAVITTILLEIVSFVTTVSLGEYRKTVLFPFYTISAMAENSVTDRFSAAFIVLWVFVAVIKISIFLYSSIKIFNRLFECKKKHTGHIACCILLFLSALYTTDKIITVEIMYKIILTAIPIVLALVLPLVLCFTKSKEGNKND